MACGEYSTVALLGSGELYAWGRVAESPVIEGFRVDFGVESMLRASNS